MKDRPLRVIAIDQYLTQKRINDPVLDGLRSAVRYDKTYFDKIVASLLPLLEKLTTGRIGELLSPDYMDLEDPRPIFDWMQVIRKRAVVYVGLDALSDTEVAAAVGNSMFSDLVSVAGHIYKFGIDDGLPGAASGKVAINVHADEFNELMGDEFIPMINKGGGAGMQVTAYTQTMSDIEAKIRSRAKAGQVIGNFNNLFMLRVRETATVELLTNQLRKVQVFTSTPASSANDAINGDAAFTSNTHDQIQSVGADGEMFNREGTPWPESDLTIVDLATYAREGYNAQLSIAYISLLNTVNNIAERDQYKGRPIVKLTDEGHIITKNPLPSPYAVKITKMWRKLGAWFWLATQNVDDLPPVAAPMLNMIEWWICLNMPPDEVEKISSGKYTEGVILSKSMEVLFRAVPPTLYLALAMTEPEEKKQRYDIMQATGVDELGAAIQVAADLDRLRGIEPLIITFPDQTTASERPA